VQGQIEALKKEQGQAFDLTLKYGVGAREAYVAGLEQHRYHTELLPDGRLRVTSTAREERDRMLFFKLAYETGVQLRQLREVKHSLDDVFDEVMDVD